MRSIRSKFLAGGALALASSLACAADLSAFANSAGLAIKAATLSDAEVVDLANKSCAALDRDTKIAAPGSKYAKRLATALKPMKMDKFNSRPLSAKVYLVKDVNAFAMDNGCGHAAIKCIDSGMVGRCNRQMQTIPCS